jgi:5,6-dimethylbenzimidazole synthase
MTDLRTAAVPVQVGDRQRYDALMDVVANRITTRAFQPDYVIPREHFELIVDAARHGPSGANAQPWRYIVVTDPDVKRQISEYFVAEQGRRARLGMKFPTPNYHGMATAPGLVVVATDFRFIRAFPVLRGYNVWWVTAIGQQDAQDAIKPLLDVPDEISVIDIMCFGPPAKPVYKRWKKDLSEIISWDRYDRSHHMNDEELEEWIKTKRHRVMYRSEENVD